MSGQFYIPNAAPDVNDFPTAFVWRLAGHPLGNGRLEEDKISYQCQESKHNCLGFNSVT
jgi:hypothetical protein